MYNCITLQALNSVNKNEGTSPLRTSEKKTNHSTNK